MLQQSARYVLIRRLPSFARKKGKSTNPSDPGRDEYRQSNTMGAEFRHWRRAKIGRRFRLFFRYDTKALVVIFAWGSLISAIPRLLSDQGVRSI